MYSVHSSSMYPSDQYSSCWTSAFIDSTGIVIYREKRFPHNINIAIITITVISHVHRGATRYGSSFRPTTVLWSVLFESYRHKILIIITACTISDIIIGRTSNELHTTHHATILLHTFIAHSFVLLAINKLYIAHPPCALVTYNRRACSQHAAKPTASPRRIRLPLKSSGTIPMY